MSGYTGQPDAESEHAMILNENGINAAREDMAGPVYEDCIDCGDEIPARRIEAALRNGMKCLRCISCQEVDDKKPKAKIKMLDRIL